MTEEQGVAFLTALRVKQIRVKGNGWIEGRCPLALWTHKNHRDSTPSFGLRIAPGERSHFMCFACRQGSAEELVGMIALYAKGQGEYDFVTCHQLLMDELQVMPLPPYGEFGPPVQVFSAWPNWWTESFTRVQYLADPWAYVQSRGITVEMCLQYDLRFDPKRQMIIAPYHDVFGRLAGARGRSILPEVSYTHHEYTFQGVNNSRLCWYHEQALNLQGPVVVVEGQFDVWRTVQAYPKVVAALTSKPNLEKMKKLGDCGMVIQIPDRDEAGQQSVSVYAKQCQQLGLQHRVVRLDEGVKDPAECAVAYLHDRIQSALECNS